MITVFFVLCSLALLSTVLLLWFLARLSRESTRDVYCDKKKPVIVVNRLSFNEVLSQKYPSCRSGKTSISVLDRFTFTLVEFVETPDRIYIRSVGQSLGRGRFTLLSDNESPPKFAEYLLHFLPKKDRETILGDLEEEYAVIYTKFGKRKANVWYWWQVLTSFLPYIKRLLTWGVMGWLGNVIRRLIP